MRVAVYARASTDDRDGGLQFRGERDNCEARGWEVLTPARVAALEGAQ